MAAAAVAGARVWLLKSYRSLQIEEDYGGKWTLLELRRPMVAWLRLTTCGRTSGQAWNLESQGDNQTASRYTQASNFFSGQQPNMPKLLQLASRFKRLKELDLLFTRQNYTRDVRCILAYGTGVSMLKANMYAAASMGRISPGGRESCALMRHTSRGSLV
ncbi:hypothetical protein OsI_20154 [Oryza sativa Indica Group]|uniref:Uncharacterized protein n=1 Tax=Oryza sativa subsp. indica TaxID=39946 RepID=A2Y584_ORYSI|nr:hypothetical protein OsI_20154 [Oryza sativa Indica Group]